MESGRGLNDISDKQAMQGSVLRAAECLSDHLLVKPTCEDGLRIDEIIKWVRSVASASGLCSKYVVQEELPTGCHAHWITLS